VDSKGNPVFSQPKPADTLVLTKPFSNNQVGLHSKSDIAIYCVGGGFSCLHCPKMLVCCACYQGETFTVKKNDWCGKVKIVKDVDGRIETKSYFRHELMNTKHDNAPDPYNCVHYFIWALLTDRREMSKVICLNSRHPKLLSFLGSILCRMLHVHHKEHEAQGVFVNILEHKVLVGSA
jgi:hypothetical protein